MYGGRCGSLMLAMISDDLWKRWQWWRYLMYVMVYGRFIADGVWLRCIWCWWMRTVYASDYDDWRWCCCTMMAVRDCMMKDAECWWWWRVMMHGDVYWRCIMRMVYDDAHDAGWWRWWQWTMPTSMMDAEGDGGGRLIADGNLNCWCWATVTINDVRWIMTIDERNDGCRGWWMKIDYDGCR